MITIVLYTNTRALRRSFFILPQNFKCSILFDLKISEFTHSDAGQMNIYLNYYKENEEHTGDDSPIGIILCSGKNAPLVKYATMGLPQQLFFSRYLIN
ncbi:MAG: DUF1016 family protein [Ferruginibacter sp.]|nr:DUF1016 family protein [Ferruginibacter sp.]